MMRESFFTEWVGAADALPLIVVGSDAAVAETMAKLHTLFAPTDIYTLEPSGRTITIAEIRALQRATHQRAWSGNRLVVITQAEKLSTAAAQALLKTLEESTRTSRFVLTTRWHRRLLPTIRSRCIRVAVRSGKPTARPAATPHLPASLLARLAAYAGDAPLSPETLEEITRALEEQLRKTGPTPTLKMAYMRLRDYHRIIAEPGGNQKLARDVLLASLPPTV